MTKLTDDLFIDAAARTAVLLDNALLNERAIQVELAPPGFSLTSDANTPQLAVHSVPASVLRSQLFFPLLLKLSGVG